MALPTARSSHSLIINTTTAPGTAGIVETYHLSARARVSVDDMKHVVRQDIVDDVARGTEAYLHLWERATAR